MNVFAVQKLLFVQGFKRNAFPWYIPIVVINGGRQVRSSQNHRCGKSAHVYALSHVVQVLEFGCIYLFLRKEELTVFLPQSCETSGMAECGSRGDHYLKQH